MRDFMYAAFHTVKEHRPFIITSIKTLPIENQADLRRRLKKLAAECQKNKEKVILKRITFSSQNTCSTITFDFKEAEACFEDIKLLFNSMFIELQVFKDSKNVNALNVFKNLGITAIK